MWLGASSGRELSHNVDLRAVSNAETKFLYNKLPVMFLAIATSVHRIRVRNTNAPLFIAKQLPHKHLEVSNGRLATSGRKLVSLVRT